MELLYLAIGFFAGISISHLFMILYRGVAKIIIRPTDIKRETNLNTFGAWALYILLAICSPLIFIFKIGYLLTHRKN